ncbi:MAG: MFS transporter [Spirochaetales bacterium]|nr:MFS transporter [Spirochaetales bacterium]MCF7938315.1 MFS transporter [Spirochaetales bacterium]
MRSQIIRPERWPFFYGWIILGFSTLGMLMSVPGQTVGVSLFTDFLIEDLSLSRQVLSLAYLVGTIGSALLLTRAGKLYDLFGARIMAVMISVLLGGILVYLSFSDSLAAGLGGWFKSFFSVPDALAWLAPFLVITAGFFFLRFLGQGMLTLISRNAVMEWFEQRRGFANGILGVAVSFGFSYSPRLLDDLISMSDWHTAWRMLALVVGVGYALLALLFMRDRPEDHGLLPDGDVSQKKQKQHPELKAARGFTLREARKTFTFWAFSLSLLLSALIVTAFTFHVVSIFSEAGLGRSDAVAIFFPSAIVAVCIQFLASYSSDYTKLKYLLMAHLGGMLLLLAGIASLHTGCGVFLIIAGSGTTQGLMGVNGNITWARFFGRKHLGEVSGFANALIVAGSAVGPYLFSLSLDISGTYIWAAGACGITALVLLAGAWRAERPD